MEDGVEARGQPGDVFGFVGDEEGELAEDGLGLVAAGGVAVDEAAEGIGAFDVEEDGEAAVGGLVIEEVEEAALGVFGDFGAEGGV